MTCFITELLSPSQIGPHSTRMSAAITVAYRSGQASEAAPCSVMSGWTPTARSRSTGRITRVCTPAARITAVLRSINPSVLLVSGDGLRVQFR